MPSPDVCYVVSLIKKQEGVQTLSSFLILYLMRLSVWHEGTYQLCQGLHKLHCQVWRIILQSIRISETLEKKCDKVARNECLSLLP